MRRYLHLISKFPGKRIAVVGDFVCDIYIYGKPMRLSREAPVIIVEHQGEERKLGCAGNCVNNIAALGAEVYAIGVVGRDDAGRSLSRHLEQAGVKCECMVVTKSWRTTTKTRIMAGDLHTTKQQVIRIDRIGDRTLSEKHERSIIKNLRRICSQVNGWLIADYGLGVVTDSVFNAVKDVAGDKPVVVDSRHRLKELTGATLASPNEAEAEAVWGKSFQTIDDIFKAGKEILENLKLKALLITRGNEGMTLFEPGRPPYMIPIRGEKEVTDVTGAGDTVSSLLTLSLTAGASFRDAAELANFAAGVVVMKRGAATCSPAELEEIIRRHNARRGFGQGVARHGVDQRTQ